MVYVFRFCFSSRRRHTRCALVTGVQTCALPISSGLVDHADRRLSQRNVQSGKVLHGCSFPMLVAVHHRPRSDIPIGAATRSEEHTSEIQSLIRTSYAVFCLKNRNLPPSAISMQNDCRSDDTSTNFKTAEGPWYRYAPSY